jgi:hypothetical protein
MVAVLPMDSLMNGVDPPRLKDRNMKEALDEAGGYVMVMAKQDWLDSTLRTAEDITRIRRLWVRVPNKNDAPGIGYKLGDG